MSGWQVWKQNLSIHLILISKALRLLSDDKARDYQFVSRQRKNELWGQWKIKESQYKTNVNFPQNYMIKVCETWL